jgi:hypothetical protein
MLDKFLIVCYNGNFGPLGRGRPDKNQVVKVYKKSPQNGAKFLTHKQSVLSLNLGVSHVFGGKMLSSESVLGQEVRTIVAILVELAEGIFHSQSIIFIFTREQSLDDNLAQTFVLVSLVSKMLLEPHKSIFCLASF